MPATPGLVLVESTQRLQDSVLIDPLVHPRKAEQRTQGHPPVMLNHGVHDEGVVRQVLLAKPVIAQRDHALHFSSRMEVPPSLQLLCSGLLRIAVELRIALFLMLLLRRTRSAANINNRCETWWRSAPSRANGSKSQHDRTCGAGRAQMRWHTVDHKSVSVVCQSDAFVD
eukprot:7384618-Prymnesium_polylepis.1